MLEIALTYVQDTLHLALLNYVKFTHTHLSSLLRLIWMAYLPSSMLTAPLRLMSSANMLRAHSITLTISLTMVLNNIGPNSDT